jgi:microcystin-dependent protein
MAEPFLGEIKLMAFGFAPKAWARCDGAFLPINQNQALFSLLGTQYGGDGRTTFALPDLRGRVPIHRGSGWLIGQAAGASAHTLVQSEMPAHVHLTQADATVAPEVGGNQPGASKRLAGSVGGDLYGPAANLVPLPAQAVGSVGGSQPHLNIQPSLVLTFCIALQGIYPSRN